MPLSLHRICHLSIIMDAGEGKKEIRTVSITSTNYSSQFSSFRHFKVLVASRNLLSNEQSATNQISYLYSSSINRMKTTVFLVTRLFSIVAFNNVTVLQSGMITKNTKWWWVTKLSTLLKIFTIPCWDSITYFSMEGFHNKETKWIEPIKGKSSSNISNVLFSTAQLVVFLSGLAFISNPEFQIHDWKSLTIKQPHMWTW